jgi:hypothetical protein
VNPAIVGTLTFALTFGTALAGLWLRARLPQHYLDGESKDTIKVGVGFIATMTALVLCLVTASAKNSFDAMDSAVKEIAMQVLALDSTLRRYGTDSTPIRQHLQKALETRIHMIWPEGSSAPIRLDPTRSEVGSMVEGLADEIRGLRPRE